MHTVKHVKDSGSTTLARHMRKQNIQQLCQEGGCHILNIKLSFDVYESMTQNARIKVTLVKNTKLQPKPCFV